MEGYHRKPNDIVGMQLSPTEEKILLLVADGYTISEIARNLYRGTNTINTHLRQVREKLQARNTTNAVYKFLNKE